MATAGRAILLFSALLALAVVSGCVYSFDPDWTEPKADAMSGGLADAAMPATGAPDAGPSDGGLSDARSDAEAVLRVCSLVSLCDPDTVVGCDAGCEMPCGALCAGGAPCVDSGFCAVPCGWCVAIDGDSGPPPVTW